MGLSRLARLRDVNTPQRLGPITTGFQLDGEIIEEHSHRFDAPGFDVGDRHTVDPRSALIRGHVNPCPPHHIAAGDLVEEGHETDVSDPAWHCDTARAEELERNLKPSTCLTVLAKISALISVPLHLVVHQ